MNHSHPFALFLFYSNLKATLAIARKGVHGIVVDWEANSKYGRQRGYDTQVNTHTVADLEELRIHTQLPIICRVNGGKNLDAFEINLAVETGANEILLPMVQSLKEVEKVLKIINGRCELGILIETIWSVGNAKMLSTLPISRAYFGFNDYAIETGESNIFLPLLDGTVESVRSAFSIPFGFAGLTHPALGSPISCILILKEMVRLHCDFTFLRRSFYRDLQRFSAEEILDSIQEAYRNSLISTNEGETEQFRDLLFDSIQKLDDS